MTHVKQAERRLAFNATLHCLTGCAIGEIAGMVIGTSMGIGMWQTVALAVTLAFITGFGLTMIPLFRSGMRLGASLRIAFAADAVSVTIMEVVDNLVMIAIPGAMAAGPMELVLLGQHRAGAGRCLRGRISRQPLADRPGQGACRGA
jgi:hypothetical protein